jgi:PKHD-type hydroxylase
MYNLSPPVSQDTHNHPFVTWQNGFCEDELNGIDYLTHLHSPKPATVSSDVLDTVQRISDIVWLPYDDKTEWLYNKLGKLVRALNGQFYDFNLTGFAENLQYTIYDSEQKGHYDWHIDKGGSNNGLPPRKLSIVVQLSDPSEYEGGELQIMDGKDPINVLKEKGFVTAFPSWTLHRVTPVTKGVRRSLVAWVCGPHFV